MTAKDPGRKGRPWRRARDWVYRTQDVCHGCGEVIDKTLEWPHPKSFSVDHIEPVSLHPHLALERTNLAAMHLGCNSSKGNGTRRPEVQTSRDW